MPTSPDPIDPLPDPPQTTDPENFDSDADAWLTAMLTYRTQANALAENVHDNAVEAQGFASSASGSASSASAQVAAAAAQVAAAAAAAASALNAPGTNATSTTSLAVGTGSKTLTIQTGKAYAIGQSVVIARTSDPAGTRMGGVITAHNSGTGSITVLVGVAIGSGTFTDWTLSMGTIAPGAALPISLVSSNTTATPGVHYVIVANSITLTLPTSWAKDDVVEISCGSTALSPAPIVDFGSTKLRSASPGSMTISDQKLKLRLQHTGNSTYGLV